MKNIAILLGGVSTEHEVSVITGLQVVENIDTNLYNPVPIFISQNGDFFLMKNLKKRTDYPKIKKQKINFIRNNNHVYAPRTGC